MAERSKDSDHMQRGKTLRGVKRKAQNAGSKFSDSAKEQIRVAAVARGEQRRDAVVAKVTKAMRMIEIEIMKNQGLYPANGGALTFSELVRRSGIGPKTLFATSYKDTFKKNVVDPWLLSTKGVQAASRREAKRGAAQRVSEWRELYGDLLTAYRISELDRQEAARLRAEAEEKLQQLMTENKELRLKIHQLSKVSVLISTQK